MINKVHHTLYCLSFFYSLNAPSSAFIIVWSCVTGILLQIHWNIVSNVICFCVCSITKEKCHSKAMQILSNVKIYHGNEILNVCYRYTNSNSLDSQKNSIAKQCMLLDFLLKWILWYNIFISDWTIFDSWYITTRENLCFRETDTLYCCR